MCFFRKRKKAKLEAERKAREEAERKAAEEEAARQAAEEEAARKANLERLQALQDQQKEVTVEKPKITKKPAAKKPAAKKPAAKKVEEPVEETSEEAAPKKAAKDSKSVYHVSKREEDGMWQIKYTGGRVIKLCKTKAEAMDYAKEMAANQEGTVIFHPSKGKSKGKFQKA